MVQALKGHCSRVVLQLHGSDPRTLAFARNRPLKLATRLLTGSVDAWPVLSTEEQRQWQAFDSRVPAFVVKNPYARRARRLGGAVTTPGSERPRALFVGRLVEAKGIFDLVDAFARVVAEVPAEPSLSEAAWRNDGSASASRGSDFKTQSPSGAICRLQMSRPSTSVRRSSYSRAIGRKGFRRCSQRRWMRGSPW